MEIGVRSWIPVLALLLIPFSASAAVRCADVTYGNKNYSEKMEELARLARLRDDYYNRYHEEVVSDLCKGKITNVKKMIDNGDVESSEVESIKEVLGLTKRSDVGQSYGFSKKKFIEMGLCGACADNVAQYYTKKPTSQCGVLAKKALEGNPIAVEDLLTFRKFCEWKY